MRKEVISLGLLVVLFASAGIIGFDSRPVLGDLQGYIIIKADARARDMEDTDGDGIVDTPYVLDEFNIDNYSLMQPSKYVDPNDPGRALTSLTLAVPSPPTKKECIIAATLKDENGDPLQNMDIAFYFCGRDKIGTNKTDSNGVASLKLSDDLPFFTYPELKLFETEITTTWKINALFSGTTIYAPTGSEYVYIAFVFIDYTPYVVGGGLLAVTIIGVVGYAVFRRRKKAITMPMTVKEA